MKIGIRNWNFFVSRYFFTWILMSKKGLKRNLRIITKNLEADPEIEFLTKSIWKPYGRATAMPPAWELNFNNLHIMRMMAESSTHSNVQKFLMSRKNFEFEIVFSRFEQFDVKELFEFLKSYIHLILIEEYFNFLCSLNVLI